MSLLSPDRYFSHLTHISVQHDIVNQGFDVVLLDVDNTVRPRDTHQMPEDIARWIAQAKEAGVEFCLLSNNFHSDVYDWAQSVDLPIVAKALKPLPHGFLMARHKMGGTRRTTLVIGDQLTTDVLGAHLLGMKAYLLCPLVEQDLKHTAMLRSLERAFMTDREPESVRATVKNIEGDRLP